MTDIVQAQPPISVVAVSRNDDHGGNMLWRMQHFVDGLFAQCRRHDLSAELVLVEWNPPQDRPPLAEALEWPEDMGPAYARIVTVPAEVHARLAHADRLPLFQMIGKNVGIRRARGRYVLATNIDILMNDALVRYLRDCLVPGTSVRVDRFDVPADIPSAADFGTVIGFCDAHFFRVSTRYGLFETTTRSFREGGRIKNWLARHYARTLWPDLAGSPDQGTAPLPQPAPDVDDPRASLKRYFRPPQRIPVRVCRLGYSIANVVDMRFGSARRRSRIEDLIGDLLVARADEGVMARLHTNACGDFTLLQREDWERLRGYPEWPIHSWHLDSLLLCLADASGIREITLPPQYRIYHIDHSAGWTPETDQELFSRLQARGIPFMELDAINEWGRRCAGERPIPPVNGTDWGFAELDLPERLIHRHTRRDLRILPRDAGAAPTTERSKRN